jgi:enamine deaminase RidA (YjgF/YER057c/UK114 family)
MRVEQRLAELGLELPQPPDPVGNYIGWRRAGDLLFMGGVVSNINGEQKYAGKVGSDLTLEEGYAAARLCAMNHLAILKDALGDLDRVEHFVKMVGYINAAAGFTEMPKVLNGASDLFVSVFGDAGRHCRLALGVAELDVNFPVETELTVLVSPA